MHALSCGRLRMRRNIYVPDAERSDTIELPVSAFLIRHPQGNVLFDTGCHPSIADGPEAAEARWGGLARFMMPISPPGENVVSSLERLGLFCDDIDVVVCSHLHPDHCGCNAFFTRATMICHAAELAAATAPDGPAQGYLPADWTPPTPFQEIDGQHDVFGDGRIVLLPVPGHTPGCTAALVGLDRSGSFLLASDAVALKVHLDREIAPKNTWSVEAALRSFAEIQRVEAGGATVICGHDDAQWRTLRKGGEAYD